MNKHLLLFFLLVMLFSCHKKQENKADNTSAGSRQETFAPPKVIRIADLPDSLKPKRFVVADMPKPEVMRIPKTGGKPIPGINPTGTTYKMYPNISKILPVFENRKNEIETGKLKIPLNSGEGGRLQSANYTVEDGLGNDRVSCALVDQRGAIWFGTFGGGASRLDQAGFTSFTTENGLAGNSVVKIMEDHSGNLWFVTTSGLTQYNGEDFSQYTTLNGLPSDNVTDITEDRSGKIWIATREGLRVYDPESDSINIGIHTKNNPGNEQINCILSCRSGKIRIGTATKGVLEYDPGNKQVFGIISPSEGLSGTPFNLYEDMTGKLWIGTDRGRLYCYNPQSKKILSEFFTSAGNAYNRVCSICEVGTGNLWIATGMGAFFLKSDSSGNRKYALQKSSEMSMHGVLPDPSGNLWFCTEGNGVIRYDVSGKGVSRNFVSFTQAEGLPTNRIISVYQDTKSILYFDNVRFNGTHFTFYNRDGQIFKPQPRFILEDKSGKLWSGMSPVGLVQGKVSVEGQAEQFVIFTTRQGLTHNSVYCAASDRNGNLWIGTEGGGASCFNGKSFVNYTALQGLTNLLITEIEEDRNGNIWFSTAEGVFCFDPEGEGKFINFTINQGLADNRVFSILEDHQGNIWFGTDRGLSFLSLENIKKLKSVPVENNTRGNNNSVNFLSSGLFRSFTMDDGLPENSIKNLAELPGGKIVIGCNTGLVVFDNPADSSGNFRSLGKIEVFGSQNGYPVRNVYWGQNRMFVDKEGVLWVATSSDQTGLVRFDYASLSRKEVKPIVSIRQVRIQEEPVAWHSLSVDFHKPGTRDSFITPGYISEEIQAFGRVLGDSARNAFRQRYKGISFTSIEKFYPVPQNLKLPYRHNRIVIGYGSDELARPQLMEYKYKLDGYDREWSPVVKTTSATFGNIREGAFTFQVKARYTGPSINGADEWTEPVSYSFRVLPPWHRSWWAYLIYFLIGIFLLYQFYRIQKVRLLRAEKEKVQAREIEHAREIEKAYNELKSTQTQLVHSQKMASLGELTAGIAHEIQNPLNFVNNFSEISNELIDEMKEELASGTETSIQSVVEIADDIKQNLQKIKQHGKRADAIVKSMLRHSRGTGGEKQLTDINNLCDEFFRLAYHSFQSRDNSFNVTMKRDFDPTLGKVNVTPQDIGQVLLNIVSNAFYAVSERKKKEPAGYEPEVCLTTCKINWKIEIRIKDNGTGIPSAVKEKIFQPFFTTKPTGQGTGLGLSLAYDIVTKGHGGELKVETEIGVGTTFIVHLPG